MSIPVVPRVSASSVGSPQRNLAAGRSPGSPSSRALTLPQEQKIVQDILECITDMKAEFEETKIPINDNNQQLQRFCAKVEYLLQANMKEKKNLLGRRKDYWDYFCDCLGSTKGISDGIRFVKSLGEYKTSLGKGRAFLRFCLMHNRMADSLQACIVSGRTTSNWFDPGSIWLHQDRNSVLINGLYDLSDLQFDLAPRGYDLDNAWPSFARTNLGTIHNWNISRSRTSSVSSLISIPGQETSPHKFGLSTTPSDYGDIDQISISESARSELTDKIDALEQQKSVFQQSVAHTQGELEVLNQQLTEVKSQNQQLSKDNSDLKQRYDRLQIEQETKEKEWDVKDNEHAQRSEEVEKLFEQVMSLEDKIQSQKELINDAERQNTELQYEVKRLGESVETERKVAEKKEEDLKSVEEKLTKQEEKNQELLNKVENLLSEKNNKASDQIDSVSKLEETLMSMKEVESKNLQLNSQNEDLNKKIESLKSDFKTKCGCLDEIEGKYQLLSGEKIKLENEIEKMSIKCNDEQTKAESLQGEINELKEELENRQNNFQTKVTEFDEKVKCLNNNILKLEETIELKNFDLEKINSEKDIMNSELKTLQDDNKILKEVEMNLKKENEESEKAHKEALVTLQSSLTEKETLVKTLNDKCDGLEKDKNVQEGDIKQKVEQILKLRSNMSDLDSKNQTLESKCLSLEKDLSSLKECQEIEKGSAEEINNKLEEKMEKVKNLELQIDGIQVIMEKLVNGKEVVEHVEIPEVLQQTEISSIVKRTLEKNLQAHEKINELETDKKQLLTQNEVFRQESESKDRQLQEVQTALESLKVCKNEVEASFADEKLSLEKQVQDFKNENALKEKNITELNEINKNLISEKDSLVNQNLEQTKLLEEAEENKKSLENEMCYMQEKVITALQDSQNFQTVIRSLEEKLVSKDSEIVELREKTCQVNELLRKNNEFSSNSEKLSDDLNQSHKTIEDLNESVSKLEKQLNETRTSEHELKLKCENLEKENTELDGKLQGQISNFKDSSEQMQVVTQEKSNLEQKVKELKEKLFDLDQKLKTSTKEHDASTEQNQKVLNKLEVERQNLKQHLEDALKDIDSIKQQLTQTSTQLDQAYNEKEKLEAEKSELTALQSQLSADLNVVNIEKVGLKTDLENMQKKIEEMSQKSAEFEQKTENLQKEKEDLENVISDLKSNVQELQNLKTDSDSQIQNRQIELENLMEQLKQLENEQEASVEESKTLNSQLETVQSDLAAKIQQIEQLQTEKCELDLELSELKVKNEELETALETNITQLKSDHEQEGEVLRQEVTSLQFQLSAEQIKLEQTVQTYSEQGSNVSEMEDKLTQQEETINRLEQEMLAAKTCHEQEHKQQQQELEELKRYVACLGEEKSELNSKLGQVTEELEKEKCNVVQLQTKLEEESFKVEGAVKDKDKEVADLKEDTQQLKKKLIQLIREKDSLWQKSDELSYQQKLQAKDKWLDEKTVASCMLCQTEFSFTIRKHHCRFCGRVFCYQCSDNWIQTTHSSKKSRACKTCNSRVKRLEVGEGSSEGKGNNELEDTVELPHMHKPRGVMNESTSSTLSGSSVQDDTSQASDSSSMTGHMTIPGQVATAITVSMVDGNLPDEEKEKQKDKEDIFQVISEEEVSKSLTESQHSFKSDDPNLTSSVTISSDDLEKGQINSQNETWIKPGKTFAVPVLVDNFNTTLCWEFSSYPKDVVFAVHYQTMTGSSSEVLIPPCKVDSHKQKVQGELTAKQLGIYSLMFDNTYSKLTSKKVTYRLWANKAS